MNWDAIGAIGQVLGSVAVLVTLGYLTVQVRHTREEMRRSAAAERFAAAREMFITQATHPALAEVMTQFLEASGARGPPFVSYVMSLGLSHAAAHQISALGEASWNNFQASIESAAHLSPGVRAEIDHRLVFNYSDTAPFGNWFESNKARLNPDAVRYVESVLARPNSTPI